MYLTPQDLERMAEEREGQKEQPATAPAPQQPSPATPATAPESSQPEALTDGAGPERQAAETAEEQSREKGAVTSLGQTLDYLLTEGNVSSDILNGIANLINQASGGRLQGLDDAVKGSQEIREANEAITQERVERLQNNEGQVGDRLVVGLTGVSEGAQAGVAMPLTVAARIANQDAPWSDPPAAIKGSPLGETAFAITEILVPTLLTGSVATGYGVGGRIATGAGLAGESLLETATQDSASDLIMGKELAIQMGRLATELGYDGEQLTVDLMEGTKPNAQAMVAVAGFFQNLGLNWGADALLRRIGGIIPNKGNDEIAEAVAEKTGKPKEEVAKQLDNTNDPGYTHTQEPTDVGDIDSMVSVGKPSEGNTYVSEPHLVADLLRKKGLGSDGLSVADHDYFTNWKAVVGEDGLRAVLQEATAGLKKLRLPEDDIAQMASEAQVFLSAYADAASAGIDIDEALIHFPEMVVPMAKKKDGLIWDTLTDRQKLRDHGRVDAEGYIVGAALAEEIGLRMQQAAKVASNLETAGIDFTKQVEKFLELSDKAHDVLIPLRRAKRYWHVTGRIQDKKAIRAILDPSEVGPNFLMRDNADITVKATTDAQAITVRDLWDSYKGGDVESGKLLKDYFALLSAGRSRTAIANVENLSTALREELKRGTANAGKSLYYSYMLTRLSPQVASLASNILQLFKLPIGTFLSGGNRAQAMGQIVGGWTASMDGLANAAKAFKDGRGLNTGTKTPENLLTLKQQSAQLDVTWEALKKEMTTNKVGKWEWATAYMHYLRQKMSFAPGMDLAMRGLLATDEWAKTVFAAQVATGRAFQQAADQGLELSGRVSKGSPEFKTLVQDNLREIFSDGRKSAIRDKEVLDAAKRITFQAEIPSGGNVIDKAFKALDDAAKESEFFNWVSPFTRVSYNTLEAGGVMLASSIPVVGKKALVELIPRYKKILAGEMGELAQLQLKADIAFAEHSALLWGSMASLGMMTGSSPPEGLPKQSILIPSPGTETGYIAVPYGRLEPIATPMSIIADVVTAFNNEIMSEGDYTRAIEKVLTGMALASINKSFTQGMLNTAEIFDVTNWSDYTLNQIIQSSTAPIFGSIVPTGAYGGLVRMAGSWANPSKVVTRVNEDPITNMWLAISTSVWGGGGVAPVMYDPLTGKPQMKTATLGGNDNWWGAVAGSIFSEAVIPGHVTDARQDFIQKEFNRVNFEFNMDNLRSINGVTLNPQQISMLSKDLHNHGKLSQRLKTYFNSPRYKRHLEKMEALRQNNLLRDTSNSTSAGSIRQDIHEDLRGILTEAKEAAIRDGGLSKDPDYVKAVQSRRTGIPIDQLPEPMFEEEDTQQNLLIPTR